MKRIFSGLLTAVLLVSLTACSDQTAEKTFLAMDTAIRLSAYGKDSAKAVAAGKENILRMEELLSRTLEDSDVSKINAANGDWTGVDEATRQLLISAAEYTETTGGAFDVTIAPVVEAWGFTTDTRQVPEEAELQALLETVDGTALQLLHSNLVAYKPGQVIDLGGIAKGYASDVIAELFGSCDVKGGLAALGGNVLAYGSKEDGTPWKVGVQDPKHPEDGTALVGIVELKNAFAVTSGGYQRFFEEDGKTYHHIIDPATGYPADSGLTSVTVVAECKPQIGIDTGTMCDAYSTALFVMGEKDALDFWRSSDRAFDLVLVTEDDRVVVTGGIAEQFVFNEESEYRYEIVT